MVSPTSHDLPGLDDDPSPPLRPLVWFLPPGLPHPATLDLYPRPGKSSSQQVSRLFDLFSILRSLTPGSALDI